MADYALNPIGEDTVLEDGEKKNWDVVMHGNPCDIWEFPHNPHATRGNEPLCFYACPRGADPTPQNLVPYYGPYGARWGIKYIPELHLDNHYGNDEIWPAEPVVITRNDEDFMCVPSNNGIGYGIPTAVHTLIKLIEGPINVNEIDFDKKLIGRKVWYRSQPAIVTHYCDHQGCVILAPDGIEKFAVPAEFADEEGDDFYENGVAKVELDDPHVYWFRNEDDQ